MTSLFRNSLFSFVLFQCLVCSQSYKFEGKFLGEGIECEGTYANVDLSSETVSISNEDTLEVLANAVIDSAQSVQDQQSLKAVYDAADVSKELILEVVASAVASVSAQINSPKEGCWAIAFGQAEAVAIANATVTAVAEALAQTQLDRAVVEFTAKSIENDLEVAVEEASLLLATGSGEGLQSQNETVIATSKALAINCALSKAFASIVDGKNEVLALVQAGCVETVVETSVQIPEEDLPDYSGCSCQFQNDSVVGPEWCGQWGDQQNRDFICYVEDGDTCDCSLPSKRYKGYHWRYCGPTLQTMQLYLGNENFTSNFETGYGYCPDWDYFQDVLVIPQSLLLKTTANKSQTTPAPTPSPTPNPSPAPIRVPITLRNSANSSPLFSRPSYP